MTLTKIFVEADSSHGQHRRDRKAGKALEKTPHSQSKDCKHNVKSHSHESPIITNSAHNFDMRHFLKRNESEWSVCAVHDPLPEDPASEGTSSGNSTRRNTVFSGGACPSISEGSQDSCETKSSGKKKSKEYCIRNSLSFVVQNLPRSVNFSGVQRIIFFQYSSE
jgi:hypothetical protein